MELPDLETDRLRLRALRPSDAPRVAELAGEREIARNTEAIPHPYPEADAEAFIEEARREADEGGAAVFAVERAADGELVGAVGVRPELEHGRARLGYWIGTPYWGQGYATEAAREAVAWAFEVLGVERVYAECFARNRASARVLEKIGMESEGVLRRHFEKWGERLDLQVWGLLREER